MCRRAERKNLKLSAQEATDGKGGAGLDFTRPIVNKLKGEEASSAEKL